MTPEGEQALGSRYLLHEPIGRGAMGKVWKSSVRQTGALVAIKVLNTEFSEDREVVARFVQERSVFLRLDHPNVVPVRDLIVEGSTMAVVMDLVEGPTLRQVLAEPAAVEPNVACRLGAQMAAGLTAAHAAGVVHRDLKPENVLLEPDRSVARITDFGIAHLTYGASITRATRMIGTPEYMAPELAQRGPVSAAVDIYALGVILYEMLAGARPFDGDHPMAVLRRHAEEPPQRPSGLSDELWELVAACLAKDPAIRPEAADLEERLRALASGTASPPVPRPSTADDRPTRARLPRPRPQSPTASEAKRRWPWPPWWRHALALGLVLAIGLPVALLARPWDRSNASAKRSLARPPATDRTAGTPGTSIGPTGSGDPGGSGGPSGGGSPGTGGNAPPGSEGPPSPPLGSATTRPAPPKKCGTDVGGWHVGIAARSPSAYWLATTGGNVVGFGGARPCGQSNPSGTVVGIAVGRGTQGYWLATSAGDVLTRGEVKDYGPATRLPLNKPVTGIAATPSGHGYWLVAGDGGVFTYGDAGFYGSMADEKLNGPAIDIAGTPSGRGYWLAATDGGVFAKGDAVFYGSLGDKPPDSKVTGIAATPSGRGYWLVAEDGKVFRFGDARYLGDMAGKPLNEPITGIEASPEGSGYWLLGGDGGVFRFGSAKFAGSNG